MAGPWCGPLLVPDLPDCCSTHSAHCQGPEGLKTLPLSIQPESPSTHLYLLPFPSPPRSLISCFIFKLWLSLEKLAPDSYFSADKVGIEDRFHLCALC